MSGAAKLVKTSSSPVLTSVTVDVSISNDSDVRKKRSAGRAALLGVAMEAAMADFLIVASTGRGRNEAWWKDNSQCSTAARTAAALATRATFLVKVGTGGLGMSFNGTWFAPRRKGGFLG